MRPHEQALLDEERFVDVFDGFLRFADGDGQRLEPYGSASESFAHRRQHRAVDLVETTFVDAEHRQPFVRGRTIDYPTAAYLGEVARAAQQPVGDAGRAPRSPRDLRCAVAVDLHAEDARSARDDRLEVDRFVVLEASDEPESIAQRS